MNNTWVPLFFEKYKNNNLDSINEHTKYYLELFSVITIGFIFMSPEVYKVFASEEYWEGITFIPLFAIGIFFVFLYGFPVNFEIYHKKTTTIAIGSVVTAIVNIILNFILIKKISILGGVISTVISYVIQFLYQHFASKMYAKRDELSTSLKMRKDERMKLSAEKEEIINDFKATFSKFNFHI